MSSGDFTDKPPCGSVKKEEAGKAGLWQLEPPLLAEHDLQRPRILITPAEPRPIPTVFVGVTISVLKHHD